MAIVTRLKCDACNTEADLDSTRSSGWYRVERGLRSDDGTRIVDPFDVAADLCSVPCLTSWSNRRELVAAEQF